MGNGYNPATSRGSSPVRSILFFRVFRMFRGQRWMFPCAGSLVRCNSDKPLSVRGKRCDIVYGRCTRSQTRIMPGLCIEGQLGRVSS
jgi:hypothetical protein